MSTDNQLVSHAATIIPITHMQNSLDFYKNKLEFKITFEWNNPVDYAVLKRGDVNIHLTLASQEAIQIRKQPLLYIFVHDIQKLYDELTNNNVRFNTPLDSREYQMTDFDILDPDGHILTFGQGSE